MDKIFLSFVIANLVFITMSIALQILDFILQLQLVVQHY